MFNLDQSDTEPSETEIESSSKQRTSRMATFTTKKNYYHALAQSLVTTSAITSPAPISAIALNATPSITTGVFTASAGSPIASSSDVVYLKQSLYQNQPKLNQHTEQFIIERPEYQQSDQQHNDLIQKQHPQQNNLMEPESFQQEQEHTDLIQPQDQETIMTPIVDQQLTHQHINLHLPDQQEEVIYLEDDQYLYINDDIVGGVNVNEKIYIDSLENVSKNELIDIVKKNCKAIRLLHVKFDKMAESFEEIKEYIKGIGRQSIGCTENTIITAPPQTPVSTEIEFNVLNEKLADDEFRQQWVNNFAIINLRI